MSHASEMWDDDWGFGRLYERRVTDLVRGEPMFVATLERTCDRRESDSPDTGLRGAFESPRDSAEIEAHNTRVIEGNEDLRMRPDGTVRSLTYMRIEKRYKEWHRMGIRRKAEYSEERKFLVELVGE